MKAKIFYVTMALVLALSLGLVVAVPVGAQTTYSVDDDWQIGVPPYAEDTDGDTDFATIQAAIDAAAETGDTINVAAGTYDENITIDKTLTLEGAQAGVNARARTGPESIINAQGVPIAVLINGADTVATFDGFTVDNYDTVGILAGAFSDTLQEVPLGDDPVAVHILNNIVKPPTVEPPHNNNIQVGDGTTGTIIGNEVSGALLESPDWSGSGIIVAGSSNVVISNNYVHSSEGGIQIIGYEYRDPSAPAENNLIENNLLENNECGISVQGDSIGTIIRYNDVLNNDSGIGSLAFDYPWQQATPSGTQVHYNNIVGNENYGVVSSVWFYQGTGEVLAEEVDATYNWWGTAVGAEIAAMVSGPVDYADWLTTAPSSVCMTAVGQAATAPTVVTNAASNVAFTLATLNGNLSDMGSSEGGPEVSFVWGTTSIGSPTGTHGGYDSETSATQKSGTGAFDADLTTGLTAGQTYYFRAKAQPSDMTDPVYGSELSFTTAEITTSAATSFGVTTATLNGYLDIGSATSVDVSFDYGLTQAYGSEATVTASPLSATGDFSAAVTGLTASTDYHFRAKGAIDGDIDYGDDAEFTTEHRIGISVSPTFIDFGDITAGHSSSSHEVTVTNTGTAAEDFTTTLANESSPDFYADNLAIDSGTVAAWAAPNVAIGGHVIPGLVLSIPITTPPSEKTATIIFWAELAD